MTNKVRVLAGLSEITLEEGNKTGFIGKSHTRILFSSKWKCYHFVDHPWRHSEGREKMCCQVILLWSKVCSEYLRSKH